MTSKDLTQLCKKKKGLSSHLNAQVQSGQTHQQCLKMSVEEVLFINI